MSGPRRREHRYADDPVASVRAAFVARRLALGLTQRDVADLAGVSEPTVQRFESGAGSATLATVAAIAEVLGVRVVLEDARGRRLEGNDG